MVLPFVLHMKKLKLRAVRWCARDYVLCWDWTLVVHYLFEYMDGSVLLTLLKMSANLNIRKLLIFREVITGTDAFSWFLTFNESISLCMSLFFWIFLKFYLYLSHTSFFSNIFFLSYSIAVYFVNNFFRI